MVSNTVFFSLLQFLETYSRWLMQGYRFLVYYYLFPDIYWVPTVCHALSAYRRYIGKLLKKPSDGKSERLGECLWTGLSIEQFRTSTKWSIKIFPLKEDCLNFSGSLWTFLVVQWLSLAVGLPWWLSGDESTCW